MSVRHRGKSLLVTYPHCNLELEDIRERMLKISKLNEANKIMYMIVAKEFHQDGDEHRHVYILLEQPALIGKKDMKCLDLLRDNKPDFDVENPQFYHPNLEHVKSPKEAIRYVKKEGNYIVYGRCPYTECLSCQEKNRLLREKSLLELVENGDVSIFKVPQLQKAISILQNELLEKQQRLAPEVWWYWGPTGSGKTRSAVEKAKEVAGDAYWISHGNGQWYDGYKGQQAVILDDVRAATWEFSNMLRITDRYKFQVPIKGGFVWWNPKLIIITAPDRPEDIYKNYTTGETFDGIEQLLRRIGEDRIREFSIN